MRFLMWIIALVMAAPTASAAKFYVPEIPQDPENLSMYLMTVDAGPIAADRFGHVGIRVVDQEQNTDAVFHWGKYSFKSPLFLWDFFRGELTYSMGIWPYRMFVSEYNDQRRNLYQDKLNLTNTQKLALLTQLRWNSFPENRDFSYQYWFKNCATVPRDYLDGVLDGGIRAAYYKKGTDTRFRDYVRAHLGAIPGIELALDLIMNGRIDRSITKWEEMFLPMNLRANLAQMPAIDDLGNPVPGSKLLIESRQLLSYPMLARATSDYLWLSLFILVPLFPAGGLVAARRRVAARRVFGFGLMTYGLVAGTFGTVFLLNWVASGHPDTWSNANLFVLWPVDFLFATAGWRLMRHGRPIKDRWPFPGAMKYLALSHLVGTVALALLYGLGMIDQDVQRTLVTFGSYNLLLMAALLTTGLENLSRKSPVLSKAQTDGVNVLDVPSEI